MKRTYCLIVLFAVLTSAQAALVTHTPLDAQAAGVAQTPPFGTLAAGGAVGASLKNFGVDYTFGNVEGYFNDPPLAFCGINGSNECDLLTAVDGRIVVQGTLTQGLTDFLQVEAGNFDSPLNGTLRAFGIGNNLLASVTGVGIGPHGRTLFTILRGTSDIAFFSMATPAQDAFGVNQVSIDTPVNGNAVPEPATLALLGLGLAGLGFSRRRKAT